MTDLTIILGNQLCNTDLIKPLLKYPVFMCESDDLCTHFKYHKLKILFFLTAMREFSEELKNKGYLCHYHQLQSNKTQLFCDVLSIFIKNNDIKRLHMLEIEDHFFRNELLLFCEKNELTLTFYPSPFFLTTHQVFKDYLNNTKKPFMKHFYERQRKDLNVLIENNKPVGGKWSFDEENRKKTPKNIIFPSMPKFNRSCHLDEVKKIILKKFDNHIGNLEECWFPTNRDDAHKLLDYFIEYKFKSFGHYEDAIDNRSVFLFHSSLSCVLNIGLLTPNEVLKKVLEVVNEIPINSFEGFIRQLIGWREFIRGIYHNFDHIQQEKNFFNHQNKLTSHWYTASTLIRPLDDAINQALNYGYTHHINRLMVIGNIMMMCKICPKEVFKWFMECFIDSSDWVMAPNVFGMSQFSDGGIFATKPYFCGSNYIRKMSHYKKEPWCETVDALYWRFIADNKEFFSKNYRMKFMVSKLKSFDREKLDSIMSISDEFILKVTNQ